jgi:hypothetical protein
MDGTAHRVDRVLGFFSSRRIWDSPNPLTRRRVCPPPPGSGKGAHSLAREGLGEYFVEREINHNWPDFDLKATLFHQVQIILNIMTQKKNVLHIFQTRKSRLLFLLLLA